MLYDENEDEEGESSLEATYTVNVDGGRKVVMTGDPADLDKIVGILKAHAKGNAAAATKLLEFAEKFERATFPNLPPSGEVIVETFRELAREAIALAKEKS